jgi:hypothetical protein
MLVTEARYLIGTCGYSYAGLPPNGWTEVFYPKPGRKRVDELEFYAAASAHRQIEAAWQPSAERQVLSFFQQPRARTGGGQCFHA